MSDESGVRRALAGDDVLSVIRAAFTDQGEPVASLWAELEQSDALRASLLVDVWVLSPLSVVPDRQGSGVGTRVLAAALDEASVGNTPLLFLEVDPGYYGARGFERASEHGFAAPRLRGLRDPMLAEIEERLG